MRRERKIWYWILFVIFFYFLYILLCYSISSSADYVQALKLAPWNVSCRWSVVSPCIQNTSQNVLIYHTHTNMYMMKFYPILTKKGHCVYWFFFFLLISNNYGDWRCRTRIQLIPIVAHDKMLWRLPDNINVLSTRKSTQFSRYRTIFAMQ